MDIKKIETVLEEVTKNINFSPEEGADLDDLNESFGLSFPKILDFSFPDEEVDAPVVQIGEITYVGDGLVHIAGLDKATMEELIEIRTEDGVEQAFVLGIQEGRVEAVVLGDYSKIKRGDQAKTTSGKLTIPVGEDVLGRVINPLGQVLDGKGPLKYQAKRDVEFPAPGVMDRSPINQPLHTGVLVIDTTIPVGKGQRELVVGDRKTGKTRTMLDIICNQKGQNVYCIYVGVGVQAAKAKAALELLERRGALKYTTMVMALADDSPVLQYMAPYVGAAIGEYFMYQGKDALVIYDDLSKQAKAYRQVSLLLKRSPGRDAYPGDIFFLHSRLLERASKLSSDLKFGSLTALPIAETQAGDVSDYIITNLMSITDGHIYLDANLMHEGILPAVNSGLSVSRIGGKVQTPMLRKVGELAGRISARYNEVKSFETINTEVADETLLEIKRGKRVKQLLSQDSEMSMSADEEVVFLGIGTSSRMDHLALDQISIYKEKFIDFYRQHSLYQRIKKTADETKEMDDLNGMFDQLFLDFCRTNKLPLPPNKDQ